MSDGRDIIYLYDGSFEGLLCCVFEAVAKKETPLAVYAEETAPVTLFAQTYMETDPAKARRVWNAVPKQIGAEAVTLCRTAFLSGNADKDTLICSFLQLGFRKGRRMLDMLTDDIVRGVRRLAQQVENEAHQFKQFIRFSLYDEVLAAVIEPKNHVLPLLREHFSCRYRQERFLIYDRAHGMALVYRPRQAILIPVDNLQLPDAQETELQYRALWKTFYDAVAIEERYNPQCRMSHMPKRYWKNMTEFTTGLPGRQHPNQLRSPRAPCIAHPKDAPEAFCFQAGQDSSLLAGAARKIADALPDKAAGGDDEGEGLPVEP